jgi:DNA-directed RNA polymerase subunit beta
MTTSVIQKHFSKYREPLVEVPNLVENQIKSYDLFLKEGFGNVLKEFTPISDYSGKKFDLEIVSFEIGAPKLTEADAKAKKLTYDAPIRAKFKLKNKTTGEEKTQELFLADIPGLRTLILYIICIVYYIEFYSTRFGYRPSADGDIIYG